MLTGKQKAHLRGLGNTLEAVIQLGKGGISETVIRQVNDALTAHELIKGRVLKNYESEPDEAASELATAAEAELVQLVGRVFLLYRKSPEKSKIIFPDDPAPVAPAAPAALPAPRRPRAQKPGDGAKAAKPVRPRSPEGKPKAARSSGSRPAGPRASGSRPAGSRPAGSRPAGSRPAGSRTSEGKPKASRSLSRGPKQRRK